MMPLSTALFSWEGCGRSSAWGYTGVHIFGYTYIHRRGLRMGLRMCVCHMHISQRLQTIHVSVSGTVGGFAEDACFF